MTIDELSGKLKIVADRYAATFSIHRDDDWYIFKLQEELGELTQSYLMLTERARRKGNSTEELRIQFEEEIADTFSQIVLLALHFDIDIVDAVDKKWFKHLPE